MSLKITVILFIHQWTGYDFSMIFKLDSDFIFETSLQMQQIIPLADSNLKLANCRIACTVAFTI